MATDSNVDNSSAKQRLLFLGSLVATFALVVTCVILAFMLRRTVAERDAEFARADSLEAKVAEATIRAARLEVKLTATEVQRQLLADQSSQLKSDANVKEQALAEAQARAESAQTALQRQVAPNGPVPVSITFNRSSSGKPLAGIFTNTSPKDITVAVQVSAAGNVKQERFVLQIPAGGRKEIGAREGWQFAPGDTISMISNGFLTSNLHVQ